ncbi:hypothetical protein KM043_016964 [Ampulex compressa]|nr:hypothetical protein KM043_016964 [Ampulex compressa]
MKIISDTYMVSDNKDVSNIDVQPRVLSTYEFPASEIAAANELANNKFPPDFYFGAGSSAYQFEGAWNVSDKGESIFDHMLHMDSDLVIDKSNGDVASDFYHKYKEDIRLAKSTGCNMYKISLSWSRILPTGYSNNISQDGIRFYNSVIDEMLANGIEPMISLFHWDLPYSLQKLGGWTNTLIITWFTDYARVAFDAFGDRVKYWTTINDPAGFCTVGYGESNTIPGLTPSGITDYLCGFNVLLAHASVYRMYATTYQPIQKGKVGISFTYKWFEPDRKDSINDTLAAERAYQWHNEWMTHPIFSESGDYPPVMKDTILINSFIQGFSDTRLPTLTEYDINFIRGTADFLGVNFYNAAFVRTKDSPLDIVSFNDDGNFVEVKNNATTEFPQSQNTPWALGRLVYHEQHLTEVLKAMQKGVRIRSYLTRSLIDGFEWEKGYTVKYGLYSVDFNDENRPRLPRLSSTFLSQIYETRNIQEIETVFNETINELSQPWRYIVEVSVLD